MHQRTCQKYIIFTDHNTIKSIGKISEVRKNLGKEREEEENSLILSIVIFAAIEAIRWLYLGSHLS